MMLRKLEKKPKDLKCNQYNNGSRCTEEAEYELDLQVTYDTSDEIFCKQHAKLFAEDQIKQWKEFL